MKVKTHQKCMKNYEAKSEISLHQQLITKTITFKNI